MNHVAKILRQGSDVGEKLENLSHLFLSVPLLYSRVELQFECREFHNRFKSDRLVFREFLDYVDYTTHLHQLLVTSSEIARHQCHLDVPRCHECRQEDIHPDASGVECLVDQRHRDSTHEAKLVLQSRKTPMSKSP